MIATCNRKLETVEALCKGRANVNLPHEACDLHVTTHVANSYSYNVFPIQRTGLTALFLAAKSGHEEVFEKLLQCGAAKEISVAGLRVNVDEVALIFKRKAIKAQLEKHKLVRASQLHRSYCVLMTRLVHIDTGSRNGYNRF